MLSSTSFEKLNNQAEVFFSVINAGATVPSLPDGAFTKRLWDPNDVNRALAGPSQIPVTIAELGGAGASGRYYAVYTNDTKEEWRLEIVHPTYFPNGLEANALVYATQEGDTNDSSMVFEFTVLNGSTPVTGLVTGSFTFELWNPSKVDVSGSVPVTITELGNGKYRARASAASEAGNWFIVIKHAVYKPTGYTGVWRFLPGVATSSKPTITSLTNDNTGTSATAVLEAQNAADELFIYYRTLPSGLWTLFGSSRIGSGSLQITGLTDQTMYEMICIASQSGSPVIEGSLPSEPVRVYVTDAATQLTAMRQALYDWVTDTIPWKVAWAPVNDPQLPLPFATVRMRPTQRVGDDYHTQPDAAGIDIIYADLEFMFEIELLGEESPEAADPTQDYAEQLASSLQKRTVVDTLASAGIASVETLPIQDLTDIASVDFQERALLEVRFRIGYVTTDEVDPIETAELPSGTVIP